MKPLLHLPVDFELRDDVRTLGRLLVADERDDRRRAAFVSAFLLRLWLEWARAGVEWRPLAAGDMPSDAAGWAAENLTHLIESAVGWHGESGRFVHLCIVGGTLRFDRKAELGGLTLVDFALYNPHLLPGFVSAQQKGGFAKAERARLRESLEAAAQQQKLIEARTGPDLFAADVDPAERRRALALIMTLDGACGRPLRSTADYESDAGLLRDAVAALRRSTSDDLLLLQRYLVRRRFMPDAAPDAGPVIRGFDDFLRKAKE